MQLKAGYIIDCIDNFSSNLSKEKNLESLIKQLSYFNLESKPKLNQKYEDSIVSVVNNLITRGTPTLSSTFIEDILSTSIGRTRKNTKKPNTIEYKLLKSEFQDLIYRSLHIIDSRLKLEDIRPAIPRRIKEKLNHAFLYKFVPEYIGEHCIQLIEKKRKYKEIFEYSNNFTKNIDKLSKDTEYTFLKKQCDFSVQIPYSENNKKGLSIEIDDSLYVDNVDYIQLDKQKDLLNEAGWADPLLIKRADFDNINTAIAPLQNFSHNDYFDIIRKNYESPIYQNENGLEAMQLALTPFAIARIQKTIIEYLRSGLLKLDDKEWNIAVIERDVPCGFLAFKDLKNHFNKLFCLEGSERQFPKVNLSIYYTDEFEESHLNLLYQGTKDNIKNFDKNENYDLVLDVSILQRYGLKEKKISHNASNYAKIRSVYSISSKNSIQENNLIYYKLSKNKNSDTDSSAEDCNINDQALVYFLKNIFRKKEFIDGQVDSIKSLLQLKNTLHVSQPASGKSLIFKFVSYLQPAQSFAITPTITLMKQLFNNMRTYRFDTCFYLSEILQNAYSRTKAIDNITNNQSIITFINSELFLTQELAEIFHKIRKKTNKIAYFIIDEIHCISQWSHDYKLSYNIIPEFIKNNLSTDENSKLTYFCCSSTVSHDTIKDVENKIKIEYKNIINSNYFNKVKFNFETVKIDKPDENFESLENLVAVRKQVALNRIIKGFSSDEEITPAFKIFTNQKEGISGIIDKNHNSITAKLKSNLPNTDIYSFIGESSDTDFSISHSESIFSVNQYENFRVADTGVMAATKTAGIGTDKKDLNNLIFFSTPYSLEQFYQLASRAGRNNKNFNLWFLFYNEKMNANIELLNNIDTNEIVYFEDYFHYQNLLKKFPGKNKEFKIIQQLLTKINYPDFSYKELINNALYNEFGELYYIETQPMQNPYQLYVKNDKERNLGYLDFKNNRINPEDISSIKEHANKILIFLDNVIEKINDTPLNILSSFEQIHKPEAIDGIEIAINKLKNNETGDINIAFTNDHFAKISKLIKEKSKQKINTNDLIKCYDKSISFDSFLKILKKAQKINLSILSEEIIKKIKEYYIEARSRIDTIRAINHLLNLKLIDYYYIDQTNKTINVTYSPKDYQNIHLNFIDYINNFVTKEKAMEYSGTISNSNSSEFMTIIDIYLDFIYDNIYKKRINSIKLISKIFNEAYCKKFSKSEFSYYLKELLNSGNKRIHSNPLVNYHLNKKPKELSEKDFENIKQTITEIGNNINDINHLYQSLKIIIKDEKPNFITKILYGYSSLLSESDNEQTINTALENLTDGLNEYRFNYNTNEALYTKQIEFILNNIYNQDIELKAKINELFLLKLHKNWLKYFNNTYLYDYAVG